MNRNWERNIFYLTFVLFFRADYFSSHSRTYIWGKFLYPPDFSFSISKPEFSLRKKFHVFRSKLKTFHEMFLNSLQQMSSLCSFMFDCSFYTFIDHHLIFDYQFCLPLQFLHCTLENVERYFPSFHKHLYIIL